jgi:hypothetical protein
MTKNTKIILVIIIIILLGILFYNRNKKDNGTVTPPVTEQESVLGCYVATLGKDVYTIKIETQAGENVGGKLSFKNFEKDSSSGTFSGTYKDGILLGNYSFDSEGMHSDIQTIFKKTADGFVRGFGEMTSNGEKFADLGNITYDPTYTFKSLATCPI